MGMWPNVTARVDLMGFLKVMRGSFRFMDFSLSLILWGCDTGGLKRKIKRGVIQSGTLLAYKCNKYRALVLQSASVVGR